VDLETGASQRIKLPCYNLDDTARHQLKVDDLTGRTLFAQNTVYGLAELRMPGIMDGHMLPDMGTMTPRWPWEEKLAICGLPAGADASARLYGLAVETGKADCLEPSTPTSVACSPACRTPQRLKTSKRYCRGT